MKTSDTNSAGRHVVQCVLLWAVQCQGQRNRRTELFVPLPGLATTSLALYRVMQSLHTPHPPTHCLGLMPKEELKVWKLAFYWRNQNKHSFMSTLKLQNLLEKGIGKAKGLERD